MNLPGPDPTIIPFGADYDEADYDEPSHDEDLLGQEVELLLEVPLELFHGRPPAYPNRPVM